MREASISENDSTAGLSAFVEGIASHNLAPLWERIGGLVSREPKPRARPFHWNYKTVRACLMEAGVLISPEDAERRVLILENPGLPGSSLVSNSLFAGMQLLLPGEHARPHRHTAGGMRFILEGESGHTSVDDERVPMSRGDLVLTPSWTWHEHGNGAEAVIWLDCLDVPMINLFDTSFAEGLRGTSLAPSVGDAQPERINTNTVAGSLMPATRWNYPYATCRAALMADASARLDPHHGVRMFYVDPHTGGSVLPTLSASLQRLPRGFASAPYRATDSKVFAVMEGHGTTTVDNETIAWTQNDVFVVPSWCAHRHTAGEDAVLFSYSDRAAQERLGLWRESTSL